MWRAVFRRELPDRYAVQMRAVRATPPEFVIRGTAFTTVTVNRNYRSAVHKDKGDLPDGFATRQGLVWSQPRSCAVPHRAGAAMTATLSYPIPTQTIAASRCTTRSAASTLRVSRKSSAADSPSRRPPTRRARALRAEV